MPVGRINHRLTPQSHRNKPHRFTTSHDVHNFLPRHKTTSPKPISSQDDKSLHRTQVESKSSSSSYSSSTINIHNYRAQGQKDTGRAKQRQQRWPSGQERTPNLDVKVGPYPSPQSIRITEFKFKKSGHRWPLNAERLTGRTYNVKDDHWHNNSENLLAGKRKMCDLNVNLDDNLECSWPSLTETSDEEDSDETSDSEAYSGPS